MIQKGMIIAHCDDCFTMETFVSIEAMREAYWAVARDRLHCYCPACALHHRNVGRKGAEKLEMVANVCNHSFRSKT